jgi:hypothetical protein
VSFDTASGTPRPRRVVNGIRRNGKMPILGFNALVLTTGWAKSGLDTVSCQRRSNFSGADDIGNPIASSAVLARCSTSVQTSSRNGGDPDVFG